MVETSVSSFDSRKSAVRAALDVQDSLAMRYVTLVQHLEPSGVGPNGNGDSSKVQDESTYEDHLVVVNAVTGECTDDIVASQKLPIRFVDDAAAMAAIVPQAWRAKVGIHHDKFGGFSVE
jgi:hypothetical protein